MLWVQPKSPKQIENTFFDGLTYGIWEVPRLRVEMELQLLAFATATAMTDLSCICDLHHSSWQ